ncbi:ATP-binding protein [Emticicia sp. BO119]|uniref:tetratricopeptide repeat-containing sensor histidine kinase n=1 Tax=Emticicia sp. BO119 TaxID=2757768 RepID=UPI0015F0FFD7|nr:ATP-binding protein [Emticicia sp. BO119]MBA4849426.1 two-component sensor histidine kinase [Emticicia sp. BO119]
MDRKILFILLLAVTSTVFAQTNILELQHKLRTTESDKDKIQLYLSISRYYQQKQADSATFYAIRGLKLATQLSDKKAQGQILYQLGLINIAHDNLSTAHQHLITALEIFNSLRDRKNTILTYEELGVIEGKNGNVTKAAEYLNKAIQLSKQARDTVDMVQSYLKLGCIEELNDNTSQALVYYKRAEELNKTLPLSKTNLAILHHIGKVHLKSGNHAHAITHFKKGIKQTDNPTTAHKHITFLTQAAEAHRQSGNDDSALIYHKDALAKAQKYSLPEEQAKVLIKIADIVKESSTDKSLEHLKNALSIAKDIAHPKLAAEVYRAMAEIYRQQERYDDALFTLEQQHALLDSLFIINKSQELAGLQAKNALIESTEKLDMVNQERKFEITIAILILLIVLLATFLIWSNANKIKAMNIRLAESNQVKDRLFSIIGHDLRGPIGNMPQLLSILEMDGINLEEQREIIGILKQQSEASFEVLTSLLNWGKIQLQGVAVSMTDFQPQIFINKNIGVLLNQAKNKSITITSDVPAELSVFADASHFDFIIRNLLSNAIKFSYPNSTIVIHSQESTDKEMVVFSVKDTGAGISQEQQQQFLRTNIDVSYGTKGEKGTGLGLLLIKEFIQSNGGKIWLESEEKKGSTFYFSLRKSAKP